MATVYTGRGDPERSMQLLWGAKEPPSRGPRPGLELAAIVRAAIEVADAEGLAGLSMRRVAERLGVGTMSLYRYLPGKAELLDLMMDAAGQDLTDKFPCPPAGDWRAVLEWWARRDWAGYHRHPWLLDISWARPVLGPNVLADYELMLRAVDGTGLTDREMVAVTTLVAGYVHGAARVSVDTLQAPARTGLTNEQWWERVAPLLERYVNFDRYPVMARVGDTGAYGEEEQQFEFGLRRVLDGIQVLVDARRDARPRPAEEDS